jgi:predicted RNA-binding protein with PIN domain
LPGGLVTDSVEGADAMLRDAGVLLVVDGYNVTKASGASGSLATEREWLVRALEALHLRCGVESVVVFDGDDTPVFGQPRRRGVRVTFSPAAAEADSVVVSAVSATPATVPVVVASSDGWVREHAETFGAVVISAPTLLALLRRGA